MRTFCVNLMIATATALLVGMSCTGSGNTSLKEQNEMRRRLAGELRESKLYSAAVEEYEKILESGGIDIKERASTNFLIARIYFEDLEEYEQAAAYYIRSKELDPEGSFVSEASRNLVTSLERSGRLIDAKRQLDEITNLDTSRSKEGDVAVARIGGVPIWLSDIEESIQSLPPEAQKQFRTAAGKREFMRNYVGTELLYRAAVREDMGNDPEVKKREQSFRKGLLVEKYLLSKVMPEIKIDSLDVKNFYVSNKDRYSNKPYDSVRAQVFLDYQTVKTQAAYSEYISKLARVEKVEFFDHNIR